MRVESLSGVLTTSLIAQFDRELGERAAFLTKERPDELTRLYVAETVPADRKRVARRAVRHLHVELGETLGTDASEGTFRQDVFLVQLTPRQTLSARMGGSPGDPPHRDT